MFYLFTLIFRFWKFIFDTITHSVYFPFKNEFTFCDMHLEEGMGGTASAVPASTSYYMPAEGERRWTDKEPSPSMNINGFPASHGHRYSHRKSKDSLRKGSAGSLSPLPSPPPPASPAPSSSTNDEKSPPSLASKKNQRDSDESDNNYHTSSSYENFSHEGTSMTTDDSVEYDSENDIFRSKKEHRETVCATPPTPDPYLEIAEMNWRNETDAVMDAFRKCRDDDVDDIVAYPPGFSFTGGLTYNERKKQEEQRQIEAIMRWRNDFVPEDKLNRVDAVPFAEKGYYVTPDFQFP
ncbi:hypothetical protein D9613_009185 [Agrocybe pediades]|uniref:Uncharacterized protein n=1 Tax=Agrocybe pediades TaxID=84607 RepID=A0A8H4R323_9AGAR|nr:hypothetical protein D9613_009185 [Agrocybe pediades]